MSRIFSHITSPRGDIERSPQTGSDLGPTGSQPIKISGPDDNEQKRRGGVIL
jgi:hypothetical protein